MKKADRLEVAYMMQKYGGSFVQALSHALVVADEENAQKIKDAFSEIFSKYAAMAEKAREDKPKDS